MDKPKIKFKGGDKDGVTWDTSPFPLYHVCDEPCASLRIQKVTPCKDGGDT